MKTKAEIIDETLEYYSQNPRATTEGNRCEYLTSDGRKCAVGRCCKNPQEDWAGRACDIESKESGYSVGELESLLKPEYRGHEISFWLRLQMFHDDPGNWEGRALTDRGFRRLKDLRNDFT